MEKAARLQQEAVRLQSLGKYQILMRALKAEPQFVQYLYTQLEGVFSAKGRSLVDSYGKKTDVNHSHDSGPAECSGRASPKVTKRLAITNGEPGDDGSCDGASQEERSDEEEAASGLKTLQSCSASVLVSLCSGIERIVFSKSALTALQKRGHREPPRASLLELIEFTTGLEPSMEVDVSEEKLEQTKAVMHDLNMRYGRRGLELSLPASWADQGVYELTINAQAETASIKNRYLDIQRRIPQHVTTGYNLKNLYLDMNFSASRAMLRSRMGMLSFSVILLFSSQALSESKEVARCVVASAGRRHRRGCFGRRLLGCWYLRARHGPASAQNAQEEQG